MWSKHVMMLLASKGGLHSKEPVSGHHWKKEPHEPKWRSVSANAEQKDTYEGERLSGDA